jgi:hypothetical protein
MTGEPRWPRDRKAEWITPDEGRERPSIMSGSYVHPPALSLLENNAFGGLMIDTTWAIMRDCVTSILVAILYNTVVHLGFAFGPSESMGLYESFETHFRDLGIGLGRYSVLRDQGTALRDFCTRHQVRQFLCLRHFLADLTDCEFSVSVADLVPSRTVDEFERMCILFQPKLQTLLADSETLLARASAQFTKAGLGLTLTGAIRIDRAERWEQISQSIRMEYRIPPTTNALESIHGHLNERTPRHHDFWPSLIQEQLESNTFLSPSRITFTTPAAELNSGLRWSVKPNSRNKPALMALVPSTALERRPFISRGCSVSQFHVAISCSAVLLAQRCNQFPNSPSRTLLPSSHAPWSGEIVRRILPHLNEFST